MQIMQYACHIRALFSSISRSIRRQKCPLAFLRKQFVGIRKVRKMEKAASPETAFYKLEVRRIELLSEKPSK
jgi:hypothetical protein